MEFEYELINGLKSNIFTSNNKNDGSFKSQCLNKFKFIINKNSTSDKKEYNNDFPPCNLISSLFSKEYKETLIESMKKFNNQINTSKKKEDSHDLNASNKLNPINSTYLINYNIYDVKKHSFFHIKIFGKYIKYFPIFTELTDYEKYISYNPQIERNPNFEIVQDNSLNFDYFHLKNYEISIDKFECLKEKYIKHKFTKKNITYFEDIFKYLFEEIKLNISSINVQSKYDEILLECSKLINDINEIIEEILNINKGNNQMIGINYLNSSHKSNKNIINEEEIKLNDMNNFQIINREANFCTFNNNKIRNKFILNTLNSKSIEHNFFENEIKPKNEIELKEKENINNK